MPVAAFTGTEQRPVRRCAGRAAGDSWRKRARVDLIPLPLRNVNYRHPGEGLPRTAIRGRDPCLLGARRLDSGFRRNDEFVVVLIWKWNQSAAGW